MADTTRPERDPLDDEALAAAFRAGRTPIGEHLSDSEWEQLTCDELTPPERERVLMHITSCGDCTSTHRSLIALRQEALTLEVQRPSPVAASSTRRWAMIGGLAAAAALVAAVLVDQPSRGRDSVNDVTRSDGRSSEVSVIAPAPNALLAEQHLAWQPVATADTYEIRIHTTDGGQVWTSRVTATEANVPNGVLVSGAYYFQLTALRAGSPIAASALVPFRAP